ncbi:hypothetical protein B0H10DRAFT_2222423 [Mycena sp. CBHHK59/15]|nr:hypothetical protein B0H10DRAFT_2222423 [Mycena sp. CBHHK59/15]
MSSAASDTSISVPDLSSLLSMSSVASDTMPPEKPAKAKKPWCMKKPKKTTKFTTAPMAETSMPATSTPATATPATSTPTTATLATATPATAMPAPTISPSSAPQGDNVFWADSATAGTFSLFGGGNTMGDEPDFDVPPPVMLPSSGGTRWPDGMSSPSSPATAAAAAMAECGGLPSGVTYAIDLRLLKDLATPVWPMPRPCFNGTKFPNNHGVSTGLGRQGLPPTTSSQSSPRGTIYRLSPLSDAFRTNPTPAASTASLSSVAVHSIPITGPPFGSGSHAAHALSALLAPAATGGGVMPFTPPIPLPVSHPVAPPIAPLVAPPVMSPIAPPVTPPITPQVTLPIALPAVPLAELPTAPPTAPLIYPCSCPMAKQPAQVDADEGPAPKPRGRPLKEAAKVVMGRPRGRPPKPKAAAEITTGDGDPDCQQVYGQQASGAALVDTTNMVQTSPTLIFSMPGNNTLKFNKKIEADKLRQKASEAAKGPVPNLSNLDGETPLVVVTRP